VGAERAAAGAIARALAESEPRIDLVLLEGLTDASPWPGLLAEAWPGTNVSTKIEWTLPAPVVSLDQSSYETWFAARNAHFRNRMRAARRKLEEQGAIWRLSSGREQLERDLDEFAALHHARWAGKGGSLVDARPEGNARRCRARAGWRPLPAVVARCGWPSDRITHRRRLGRRGGVVAVRVRQPLAPALSISSDTSRRDRTELRARRQALRPRARRAGVQVPVRRHRGPTPVGVPRAEVRALPPHARHTRASASARRTLSQRLPEPSKRALKRVLRPGQRA
jgi:hypothetical protein